MKAGVTSTPEQPKLESDIHKLKLENAFNAYIKNGKWNDVEYYLLICKNLPQSDSILYGISRLCEEFNSNLMNLLLRSLTLELFKDFSKNDKNILRQALAAIVKNDSIECLQTLLSKYKGVYTVKQLKKAERKAKISGHKAVHDLLQKHIEELKSLEMVDQLGDMLDAAKLDPELTAPQGSPRTYTPSRERDARDETDDMYQAIIPSGRSAIRFHQ